MRLFSIPCSLFEDVTSGWYYGSGTNHFKPKPITLCGPPRWLRRSRKSAHALTTSIAFFVCVCVCVLPHDADGLRSPLTVSRDPGMPEYQGEDEPDEKVYNR